MEITPQNLQDITTGYSLVYQDAFEGVSPIYTEVAMEAPSSGARNVYPWLGQSLGFRKWVGDRVIQNLETHAFTIENEDFENTVAVGRNAILDDTYGVFRPLMADMGRAARLHPDELVFEVLKSGFDVKGYDGQYFFDTDHPVGTDATGIASVSNKGAGTGTAWYLFDTSKMVRPIIYQRRADYSFVALDDPTDENLFRRKEFVYGADGRGNAGVGLWQLAYGSKGDLTQANYEAARAAMGGFKNDAGRPLNIRPDLLVVPPSLGFAARKILEAAELPGGGSNVSYRTARVLETAWLS